jgi:hypothetical protein
MPRTYFMPTYQHGEWGHWQGDLVNGFPDDVWVTHCQLHIMYEPPCERCERLVAESAALGTDEGAE